MKETLQLAVLIVACLLGGYSVRTSELLQVNQARNLDGAVAVVKKLSTENRQMVLSTQNGESLILFSPEHPQIQMLREMEEALQKNESQKVKIDYYFEYDSSSYTNGSHLMFTKIPDD